MVLVAPEVAMALGGGLGYDICLRNVVGVKGRYFGYHKTLYCDHSKLQIFKFYFLWTYMGNGTYTNEYEHM